MEKKPDRISLLDIGKLSQKFIEFEGITLLDFQRFFIDTMCIRIPEGLRSPKGIAGRFYLRGPHPHDLNRAQKEEELLNSVRDIQETMRSYCRTAVNGNKETADRLQGVIRGWYQELKKGEDLTWTPINGDSLIWLSSQGANESEEVVLTALKRDFIRCLLKFASEKKAARWLLGEEAEEGENMVTVAKIVEETGIKTSTLRTRIARARKELEGKIEKQGKTLLIDREVGIRLATIDIPKGRGRRILP